jgi:RES domain-containing protein
MGEGKRVGRQRDEDGPESASPSLAPHPDSRHLPRILERCRAGAGAWSGVAYRSASPGYANRDDLITGAGSRVAGARWNGRGSFHAVYASLDPQTALDEALAHFRHFNLPIESAMPRVLVALQIQLGCVLDLTRIEVRRSLRLSRRRLLDEPWRELQQQGQEALTQAIGRLAWEAEWEGLLVPSAARSGGVNVVVFPANLNPPASWITILNRGQLPPRSPGRP